MSNCQDHDQKHCIGNRRDDAVAANRHPIARTTPQRSGAPERIDPDGGPDEEDPDLYPDPTADDPPFGDEQLNDGAESDA